MKKSIVRIVNCLGLASICNLCFLAFLITGCAASKATSDDSPVPVAFDINGSFVISMSLPAANIENVTNSAPFVAIDRAASQQLFQAMYDPGRGKNRGILLTRVWATVHRFSESEMSDVDNQFERAKMLFTEEGNDFFKNYSLEGVETLNSRNWLSVKLEGGISRGIAFVTETNKEYALIVGVRVFANDDNASELRKIRIDTLRQIVESVRVEAL